MGTHSVKKELFVAHLLLAKKKWKKNICLKVEFAHNKSVTSIKKQTKQNTLCKNTVVYCSCLVSASFRHLNFSRSRDRRVKKNEYHAACEILEKTGNKIINNSIHFQWLSKSGC